MALLENLQREDLNPMEEAGAYQRLSKDFSLSQEEIAGQVGKDRSTVANTMRLLNLPDSLQKDVAAGSLSAGHGRALLALDSPGKQRQARDLVVKKGLSVRATESLVKALCKPKLPRRLPRWKPTSIAWLKIWPEFGHQGRYQAPGQERAHNHRVLFRPGVGAPAGNPGLKPAGPASPAMRRRCFPNAVVDRRLQPHPRGSRPF